MANERREKPISATIVDIQLLRGTTTFTGKTKGKVFGGIVTFKGADPMFPIVWLGGEEWTILNLTTKKTLLFYDTLTHMLVKPSELGINTEGIDVMSRMSQSFLIGAKEAERKMGIEENKDRTYIMALLGMLFIFIIVVLVLYLIAQNASPLIAGHNAATTTISMTNSSHGLLGHGVVPLNGS